MRAKSLIGIVFVAASVTGCSGGEDQNATAEAHNTIAQYEPPSITSRADYGGLIERRFQRLDTDRDGKLSKTEMPARMVGRIDRYDTNGDGQLASSEWGKMMLERFDRQDTNKDGTVTTEERQAMRAARRARAADAPTE